MKDLHAQGVEHFGGERWWILNRGIAEGLQLARLEVTPRQGAVIAWRIAVRIWPEAMNEPVEDAEG